VNDEPNADTVSPSQNFQKSRATRGLYGARRPGAAIPAARFGDNGRVAKQRVLFLCIHNSARSQMAEGLLRAAAPDRFDVFSAGIEAGKLRPEAVEVMREVGIDISGQRSKSVDEFAGQQFDLVVTTCEEAKEACPLFPGAKPALHWDFPDQRRSRATSSNAWRR